PESPESPESPETNLSELETSLLEPAEVAAGVRIVLDDDGSLGVEDGFVQVDTPAGQVYRWRCSVCGYIHEAPEPPRWCPLCGADQAMFEAIVEDPA
ncbi:MAG: rubredoxin-like domain-containing protein, partial [Acidimicrobiales bacterium]